MLENIPEDVKPHSRVILENDRWLVGVPLSPAAMYWWGNFTEWCTASDGAFFYDYAAKGSLIVFRSRLTSFRWLLHPATGEFRDYRNKRVSWNGFLMRNADVAGEMMLELAAVR
ncbi:MAG TPA: hypothetical protein VFK19_00985 [Sphingomicrobium sp.]|nr:hypothetical protein [Sphingomicrobium sp.]